MVEAASDVRLNQTKLPLFRRMIKKKTASITKQLLLCGSAVRVNQPTNYYLQSPPFRYDCGESFIGTS